MVQLNNQEGSTLLDISTNPRGTEEEAILIHELEKGFFSSIMRRYNREKNSTFEKKRQRLIYHLYQKREK